MFSIMITVASTTRPKSIAPPTTGWRTRPATVIHHNAEEQAKGMVVAHDQGAAQIAPGTPTGTRKIKRIARGS